MTLTVLGTLIAHVALDWARDEAIVTVRCLDTLRLPASVLIVAAGLGAGGVVTGGFGVTVGTGLGRLPVNVTGVSDCPPAPSLPSCPWSLEPQQ